MRRIVDEALGLDFECTMWHTKWRDERGDHFKMFCRVFIGKTSKLFEKEYDVNNKTVQRIIDCHGKVWQSIDDTQECYERLALHDFTIETFLYQSFQNQVTC